MKTTANNNGFNEMIKNAISKAENKYFVTLKKGGKRVSKEVKLFSSRIQSAKQEMEDWLWATHQRKVEVVSIRKA